MKLQKKHVLFAGLSLFLFISTGIALASSSTFLSQAHSQTVAPSPTQPGNALKEFDAQGRELGIMSPKGIYNIASGLFIPINDNSGKVGSRPNILYYQTSDCSGTPLDADNNDIDVLLTVGNQHMKMDTSVQPQTLFIRAISMLPNPCSPYLLNGQNGGSVSNLYPLIPATSPFQEPVPVPVRVKYQ